MMLSLPFNGLHFDLCMSVLWNSSFVTVSPQKFQSAVNMKVVRHEWFWRRTKVLPLLFEHGIINRSDWSNKPLKHKSLSIHKRALTHCWSVVHCRQKQKIRLQLYSQTFMCTLLTITKGFGPEATWSTWQALCVLVGRERSDRRMTGKSLQPQGHSEYRAHTHTNTHQWIQKPTRSVRLRNKCL